MFVKKYVFNIQSAQGEQHQTFSFHLFFHRFLKPWKHVFPFQNVLASIALIYLYILLCSFDESIERNCFWNNSYSISLFYTQQKTFCSLFFTKKSSIKWGMINIFFSENNLGDNCHEIHLFLLDSLQFYFLYKISTKYDC